MEEELHDNTSADCTSSEYFCDLCSLDFTTRNELEEHTWSMLHNTNLNRKQGRNCVHSCSLCKENFVGLLEFTSHLHGDSHQENIHKWRKEQHQEWSPDKQEQSSPSQELQSRPPSDWSTDDFSGFVDYFSDHAGDNAGDNAGEANMGDKWRDRGPPPRDPRDIPSLSDYPPPYGYRRQEQFDRRDRRDQFQERGYPPWNGEGRGQPGGFLLTIPDYPSMNYSNEGNDPYHWRKNSDGWRYDRFYENRDEDQYSSRDNGSVYPGDGRRASYDGDSEFRLRRDNQPRRQDNRNSRRNSNSPHRRREKLKSVVGSVIPSRKQNERRPRSRNDRTERYSNNKQKETPPDKRNQEKNTSSGTKRNDSPKSSPSSESPSSKSTRKGKPRKLARPVEEKLDEGAVTSSGGTATQVKEIQKTTRQVKTKDYNHLEITVPGKGEVPTQSATVSQTRDEVKKSISTVEANFTSISKGETSEKPLCLAKVARRTSQEDSPSSATGDSSAKVKGDSPKVSKEDFPSTAKGDSHTTTKGNSPTKSKGDSSSSLPGDFPSTTKPTVAKSGFSTTDKGDSLPSVGAGKRSLTTDKESDDPLKLSKNKQKDLLLSVKDKDESAAQSKGTKELILSSDKETLTSNNSSVAHVDEKSDPSQTYKKSVYTPGGVSFSSTREKIGLASNPKDESESLVTTDELFTSTGTKAKPDLPCLGEISNSSLSVNLKEKTLGADVSSDNRLKRSDLACSSATIAAISSLPLEQREEQLRSLLGIKKERKDTESQGEATPCVVSKSNSVTTDSETHHPVVSSSTSKVTSLGAGSVKSAASRYIPVFSQLSLSRPQCSFVHIDGVQCGAITWNKYCSYHQRVFGSEENNTQDQSLSSKASHTTRDETSESESSRRSLLSRPGSAQIFKPTTPPCEPPERLGADAGSGEESGYGTSSLKKYDKLKEKKELSEASKGSVRSSNEIDLNSTSPYKALGAAVDAPRGNIDLSTTVRGASRSLFLRASASDVSNDHTIVTSTASSTGPSIGANIGAGLGASIDLSKTVLKQGRSWRNQGFSTDSVANVDLGATVSNRRSSVTSDSGPNIDLNETIPQPGRSRTPHEFTNFDRKDAQTSHLSQHAAASSVTSRDVLHPQKHLVKIEPGQERARASPVQNTEMIDLNFSTKLLGVPHSVVTPFNTSMPSPKKPSREMTKSPSEFSSKSSVLSPPRSYTPSSPQRVSTTTGVPTEQPQASTISLPNLSLDLSRFNLPPAVRKALAERYSGKKVPEPTSGHSVESLGGRRSQPLFSEHKTEETFDQGKKASPLPARLRGRGLRSISLDSPVVRRENLFPDETTRSGLLERRNIFDANQLLGRRLNNDDHQRTGLSSSDNISENMSARSSDSPSSLGVYFPSTIKVQPFFVPSRNAPSLTDVPSQENSDELQSRGLIDLSSTSYLEGMPVQSTNQGSPTDASRSAIDSLRSPSRPSVLQSRGLIDLNSSTEYVARDAVIEAPKGLSAIKRKRLNSDRSESASSLGAEKLVKRPKQDETVTREDKPVTYRSGINVQELLTIERDEQNQLQHLHAVQSRLKSVRAQIQKLCTELDSLSSEEQRITLRMGELRNLRLSILENACYERQGLSLAPRIESSTNETSTSTMQSLRDDCRTFAVPSESGTSIDKNSRFGGGHMNYAHGVDTSCKNGVKSPRSECRDNKDSEPIETEVGSDGGSGICTNTESLLNTSGCSDVTSAGAQFSSVGTATKFVLRQETLQSQESLEKDQERHSVASKRTLKRSKSSIEAERGHDTDIPAQTSGAQIDETVISDLVGNILRRELGRAPSSFGPSSKRRAARTPGNLVDPGSPEASTSEQSRSRAKQEPSIVGTEQTTEQTRKEPKKKSKHFHPSEKALFRKKSFSDVNVSKTIEAGRKKIQSAKENMKRWKQNEDNIDVRGSQEQKRTKPSGNSPSSSSSPSAENSSGTASKDKHVPSPYKILVRDKPSPRKTTKELKKSSLFHSGKKNSKESRKNKAERTQMRDKGCKDPEEVPSKRRKVDGTSCDTQYGVQSKEKTSSKGKGQVVSAAAHTTTADLGGSGTDERVSTEDEIPTRDVDTQSDDTSSSVPSRANNQQILESLKRTLQSYEEGKKYRGPPATKFKGHTGAVCGLKVHNGLLFSCSADKTTRSFNIQTGECVKVYHGHHQAVNCVEVSGDKDRLFTGSNDQTVRSYNIKSGVCTHRFTFDGRVMCLHAAFDLLFVGLNTGIVASIDLMNNKCLERLHCHEPRGVSCLTTATEGQRKLLCCGSFDSTITVRDYKTGLLIRTFSDHNMTVLCLQVVDNILYSGSADMKVQAHNLNTGELLRSFYGHTGSVSGLQIVGRVLVTSCLDKLIRCYDLTTGDLLQVYGGQMDMIFSVLVSNGRIFSGGRDGAVVASKLDLRVYHPCKWENCKLNFGIVSHLKNHIREYHVMEQGTVEACHWAECGHQFSADDDISAVIKHVLGHVVTRTARKSAS